MARRPTHDDEVDQQDQVEPLVTSPHNIATAQVGTAIVTGAGTIASLTLAALPTSTDTRTPLTLVDAAAAPAAGVHAPVLFSADLQSIINFLCEPRPAVPLTPGVTAPTYPRSLGAFAVPFSAGVFVVSCPANTTFVANI
jgi:hypothetical protein